MLLHPGTASIPTGCVTSRAMEGRASTGMLPPCRRRASDRHSHPLSLFCVTQARPVYGGFSGECLCVYPFRYATQTPAPPPALPERVELLDRRLMETWRKLLLRHPLILSCKRPGLSNHLAATRKAWETWKGKTRKEVEGRVALSCSLRHWVATGCEYDHSLATCSSQ